MWLCPVNPLARYEARRLRFDGRCEVWSSEEMNWVGPSAPSAGVRSR